MSFVARKDTRSSSSTLSEIESANIHPGQAVLVRKGAPHTLVQFLASEIGFDLCK